MCLAFKMYHKAGAYNSTLSVVKIRGQGGLCNQARVNLNSQITPDYSPTLQSGVFCCISPEYSDQNLESSVDPTVEATQASNNQ